MIIGQLSDILDIESNVRGSVFAAFPLMVDLDDSLNGSSTNKSPMIMLCQPDDQVQYLFPFYEVTPANSIEFWSGGYIGIIEGIFEAFGYHYSEPEV